MAKDYKRGELRTFRSKLAKLKKQGLLPGKNVDVRSAYPKQKRGGKSLLSFTKHFDDVTTNKVTAIKVPDEKLRAFRKAGYETAYGRVLVPHGELETAKYVGGQITIKHPSGIERVQIPIEYHNLEQYFRDIRKNRKLIDAMKSRNEYFGFRFFGNNSSEFFSDIDLLLERLESYRDVNAGMKSRRKGAEIYRNIEILRLNSKAMRNWETPSMKTRGKTKKQNRASAKRWREAHPDKARKGTRERVAKWRASMTATEKKSMLKKQRIYAKKWRKNNK